MYLDRLYNTYLYSDFTSTSFVLLIYLLYHIFYTNLLYFYIEVNIVYSYIDMNIVVSDK